MNYLPDAVESWWQLHLPFAEMASPLMESTTVEAFRKGDLKRTKKHIEGVKVIIHNLNHYTRLRTRNSSKRHTFDIEADRKICGWRSAGAKLKAAKLHGCYVFKCRGAVSSMWPRTNSPRTGFRQTQAYLTRAGIP
ncbi:hypothetical protein cyc_02564 [Cyclospora cayetanensis]|uniref:Uncharacterized protein n=1 Tax=Cyclospora cayetanensis TaxID=88456 RepID=A0A1D3CYT7_9EIME|nr:hypothetical protein cyc_02564 [Cyclospora cayetanensis]